jgi:hypothetical protein
VWGLIGGLLSIGLPVFTDWWPWWTPFPAFILSTSLAWWLISSDHQRALWIVEKIINRDIDIGWNTTDLSAIRELRPVDRWIGGARVGVRDVVQMVGDAISREHGLSLQPHEVDQAIVTGQIEVFGQYRDIRPIVQSTTTALAQQ